MDEEKEECIRPKAVCLSRRGKDKGSRVNLHIHTQCGLNHTGTLTSACKIQGNPNYFLKKYIIFLTVKL